MADFLCPRCLTFNKRSASRCLSCQHRLHSSGWRNLFSSPATDKSPFSVDAPHAVDNRYLVHAHEMPIAQARYRTLLFTVLLLGSVGTYFRVHGPQSTEEGAETTPIGRATSVSVIEPQEVPRRVLNDEEQMIITWKVIQDFTPEVGLSGQLPRRFMPLRRTFLSTPSPKLQYEMQKLYEQWKSARSYRNWDEYLKLYDTNAKIIGVDGEAATLPKLATALKTQDLRRSFRILNRHAPIWAVDSVLEPNQVELITTEHYSLYGQTIEQKQALQKQGIPTAVLGGRHLIWTKKNNEWKITRDSFTPLNSLFYRLPRYDDQTTK